MNPTDRRRILVIIVLLLSAAAAYAFYSAGSTATIATVKVPKQEGWTTHLTLNAGGQPEDLTIRYVGGDYESISVSSKDWDETVTSKIPKSSLWISDTWHARIKWGPDEGSYIKLTIEIRPGAMWILPWTWPKK